MKPFVLGGRPHLHLILAKGLSFNGALLFRAFLLLFLKFGVGSNELYKHFEASNLYSLVLLLLNQFLPKLISSF